MNRYDLIIQTYSIYQEEEDCFKRRHYAIAAVGMNEPVYGEYVLWERLGSGKEWKISCSLPWRKKVKIELPVGVHEGLYKISGLERYGLYSDYVAKDGMGPTVFVYTKKAAPEMGENNMWKAINEAINGGVFLSIPQEDGSRKEVQAKVIAVSGENKFPDRFEYWESEKR